MPEGRLLGGQWWTRVRKRPGRVMHSGAAACSHGECYSQGRGRAGLQSGGAWASFIIKKTGKEMWAPGAVG